MGQTLTHGIYLPDEGERNCYNGLAGNWQLLDGAVGTVAEHTTQIAGKANAVHTHTKADVTDFPAYGNAAGTICEGNDSRLSDARTPVAHTHTKSDIADLFNSANVWTGENTFQAQSIYQVNSDPRYVYKSSSLEIGVQPASSHTATSYWLDKNGNELGFTRFVEYSSGIQTFEVVLSNKATNGNLSPSGNTINTSYQLRLNKNNSSEFNVNVNKFVSTGTNPELGSSNYKWKTLNGINPGALSLPNYSDTTYIDISGSIVPPTGETEINKNLGDNQYTPPIDGWLSIRCDGAKYLQIYRNSYNCPGVTSSDGVGAKLVVTLPVRKNVTYTIRIKKDSAGTEYYQLYPCLGNV